MDLLVIAFGVGLALAIFSPNTSPEAEVKSGKWYIPDYDNTDDVANKRRSGITVVTDYGTGVQYVVTPLGGITPRIDTTGKPIVIKENKE